MRLAAAIAGSLFVLAGSVAEATGSLEEGIHAFRRGKPAQAVELWRPLAENGDAEAQLFLGHAYAEGKGVAPDPRQSFQWYLKAARQGLPEAQYEVGLRYEVGDGVAADVAEAEFWYQRATLTGFCPGELSSSGRLLD
jgi:TPR repeat protein